MKSITIASRREMQPARIAQAGAPAPRQVRPPVPPPDPELVRARAYEIFRARNNVPGDEVADWLQAEHELQAAAAAGGHPRAPGRASPGEVLLSDGD